MPGFTDNRWGGVRRGARITARPGSIRIARLERLDRASHVRAGDGSAFFALAVASVALPP